MESKLKILRILLWFHIVIGILLSSYAAFAITIMMGIGGGIATFFLGIVVISLLPYYANSALAKGNAVPALCHAVYIIIFSGILLPLGAWQLYLAYKLNEHYKIQTA